MCGRFCLTADAEEINASFALKHSVVLKPRYNIAPAQVIPVIRNFGQLEFLNWGLRPSWLKEGQNPFINARMETLQERPAFKNAFKLRRCLVLANGYYEWKKIGSIKQPFYFSLPGAKLFAIAGIYDGDTCALITTTAWQQEMLVIHERMPLVLPPNLYKTWLDPKAQAIDLDTCLHNKELNFNVTAVTTKVNNPKHDVIECIKALH